MFTIVVLPFATQLTQGSGHGAVALAAYIGTMTVGSACLAVLALLLVRRPALRREGDGTRVRVEASVSSTIAFAVALVLGLTVPGVGYWGLLLLTVDGLVAQAVVRWWRRSRS